MRLILLVLLRYYFISFVPFHNFSLVALTSEQIVASEGVRETGAVASARAAEIYGLDVLAERIQVTFF